MIDVRNFNETLIGKFAPPTADGKSKVLDPCMRRSTEFPQWIDDNKHKFEGIDSHSLTHSVSQSLTHSPTHL